MKVLFLGSYILAQRIITALKSRENEVSYITDIDVAKTQIKQKCFDLVIIDSLIPKVKEVCQGICGLTSVPIVMLVNQLETDWKMISEIHSDGFVTTDASDTEILARIKALYTRFTIKSKKATV